jgi:DNA-binding NtrC family response regulator
MHIARASVHDQDEFASDMECAIWSDANVLISGGNPEDRRKLARLIHLRGNRGRQPFVVVGAQPPAGLFRPADRAELAQESPGGTLFIEEAAELGKALQAELLDMLQNRPAEPDAPSGLRRTRVIAATSHDLLERVGSNAFRVDLFYRLNAIHIVLGLRREPPKVWVM